MCAMQTNYDVLNRLINLATRYQFIIVESGKITITAKGRKILENWKHDNLLWELQAQSSASPT